MKSEYGTYITVFIYFYIIHEFCSPSRLNHPSAYRQDAKFNCWYANYRLNKPLLQMFILFFIIGYAYF